MELPLEIAQLTVTLQYAADQVQVMSSEDCFTDWPYFRKGRDMRPYVNIKVGKRKQKAVSTARFAWFLVHGRWNDGWLLHSCHNKDCWNPHHMYEGGPPDNTRDMIQAGRKGRDPRELTVEAFDEKKTLREWVQDPRCQVNRNTLYRRLWCGQAPELAISAPKLTHSEAGKLGATATWKTA